MVSAGVWVLAWWVANSVEHGSREVRAGSRDPGLRGRNASRRLGSDGPRRRRSGLRAFCYSLGTSSPVKTPLNTRLS